MRDVPDLRLFGRRNPPNLPKAGEMRLTRRLPIFTI
jgi:hypothetical protein